MYGRSRILTRLVRDPGHNESIKKVYLTLCEGLIRLISPNPLFHARCTRAHVVPSTIARNHIQKHHGWRLTTRPLLACNRFKCTRDGCVFLSPSLSFWHGNLWLCVGTDTRDVAVKGMISVQELLTAWTFVCVCQDSPSATPYIVLPNYSPYYGHRVVTFS